MAGSGNVNLQLIARGVLQDHGFWTEMPADALRQAEQAVEPNLDAASTSGRASPDSGRAVVRDLSAWLWSSIDNDDSLDLDQIEYAESETGGTRVYVAIANVDWAVPKGSPIDLAAQHNTTSLYTGVHTFHMLPERLSTHLTSLLENQRHLAMVTDMLIHADGTLSASTIYPALVQNKAKLTYDAVGAWLEKKTNGTTSDITKQMLAKIAASSALQDQLRLQDSVAQALRQRRHDAGALTLESIELQPRLSPSGFPELGTHLANRATELIEDFMIAANRASVQFLQGKTLPTLQRVVRTPKNWMRIVQLAADHGFNLDNEPNADQLEVFLQQQQKKDPERFPDLSLMVIKLLGRGEYVLNAPGRKTEGHFSLAIESYSHSTAPNRRYPDLITQRLLLAATGEKPTPYTIPELDQLAAHCTEKEDDANKAERSIRKSVAAVALSPHIGKEFEGFITGASEKGVWVRLLNPPVEGKVVGPSQRLAVGDKVLVRLVLTDPWRGYIDFEWVKRL